jgi:hypothetical protein
MTDETIYKAQEKAQMSARPAWPAWILIGLGVVLLFAGLFDVHLIDYLWPAFIVFPGLAMMYPAYKSTAEDQHSLSFLAIPGAVFVAVGALFFVLNLFDHFEAWAYTWTVIPAAMAAGVLYMTRYDNNLRLEARAHKFIRVLAMVTVGLAFFFEIIIFENYNPLMAVGLIILGIYLLVQERRTVKVA